MAASASTSVNEMQPTITVSINVKASFQPDAAWITDQLVARLRELVPFAELTTETDKAVTSHEVSIVTRNYESERVLSAVGSLQSIR